MRISTKLMAYAIAVALLMAYGVSGTYILGQRGDFNVHVGSLVQALYFTVATITTVGYGDIVPVSDTARIFTMVLIVGGILVVFGAVVGISGDFVNAKLDRLSGKLSSAELRLLKGHTILVGYGHTNALLARSFKERKRRFVVVADSQSDADSARAAGYTAHKAEEASEAEMSMLAADRASMVVIDLQDRPKTIYAALVAKSMAKRAEIFVVASSDETIRYLKEMGIRRIINPADMAASKIIGAIG
ncbi:MAG: NAD-binding protein [Candidatus Micrarchaeota archaeon]|nr:NAD-binding protein [Candidatus Micrarchaeota archaeon]